MKSDYIPRRARGATLIEMLIAMAIGVVVIGAVIVTYLGSGQAGRIQAAYSQMNQDAQIGLSILTREFQMAGYSTPSGLVQDPLSAVPSLVLTYNIGATSALFGCGTGFVDPRVIPLQCVAGAGDASPAFEVVYEADVRSTVATAGGVPTDCLGNGIPAGPPFFARNRYFISVGANGSTELSCASNNLANPQQPLLENVQAMRVWYGMQVAAAPRQAVRYATASQVNAVGAAEWNNVVSVRVCLLMRSSEQVLNSGTVDTLAYQDCDGVLINPPAGDRFLHRAYFTTSTIRSKMGL